MPYFLVDIHVNGAGQLELDRAVQMLQVAKTRLLGTGDTTRTVVAALTSGDSKLVCVIEATTADVVQQLVTIALLPAGRIRELSHFSCRW